MQVMAGADQKVDVVVQSSDGNIIDQHRWTNAGTTDRFILHPGNAHHEFDIPVLTTFYTRYGM